MKRISHEELLRNRDREEEKRLIHLTISAKKNYVFIKVENYCEEKVEVKNTEFCQPVKRIRIIMDLESKVFVMQYRSTTEV